MTDFEKVQTIVKYHLGELAASIEPTPGLILIIRHKETQGSGFLVSTIPDGRDVQAALEEALENLEPEKGRTI